jgi:hypothetical protein
MTTYELPIENLIVEEYKEAVNQFRTMPTGLDGFDARAIEVSLIKGFDYFV